MATGKKNSNDIDLMILDNGHFPNFFACMIEEHHIEDAYEDLGENFFWLMDGWFRVHEEQVQEILGDIEVDFHVLPFNLLKSRGFKTKMTEKHKDPDFFKNAFQKVLRFDRSKR